MTAVEKKEATPPTMRHHVIEAVTPAIDCGRYPIKRIVGERLVVEADIFRDGHQVVQAAVRWRRKNDEAYNESPMALVDNDRWRGEFELTENARYVYTVIAWTDPFASWLVDFRKRVEVGHDAASELLEGISLAEDLQRNAKGNDRKSITDFLNRLKRCNDPKEALVAASSPELQEIAERAGVRADLMIHDTLFEVIADRPQALFSTWYEMFPRSQGKAPGKAATFREAEARLPEIRAMGFDVLYLAPIHPIGVTNRKGPNNAIAGKSESPGSPWAIGGAAGGHTAVDPALGTIEDFDHFVGAANLLGLEVALDFAIQSSPDHPWVKEHPEWFLHRPDGSIKYAENPPKSYQDIYPLNFDTAEQAALIKELLAVVKFWIGRGIKIFRVDNPHTKPLGFWRWLIEQIQTDHPDALFLAEAFTRPKMMKALAKAGFTQSYTYFTWRNTKSEFIEYLTELTSAEMREYFRPNFFTNTPDILSPILQIGGAPAFKMRLVLAATLSPAYGVYSGYELCENEAVPGTEEYQNSEKYEIKVRDWNRPGNIKDFITRMNDIRQGNPALQQLANLRFLVTDSDQIIMYVKTSADMRNRILVAVNLDPLSPHECTAFVPPDAVGVSPGGRFRVTDLLTGGAWTWSERNYVRLDPNVQPGHVFAISDE